MSATDSLLYQKVRLSDKGKAANVQGDEHGVVVGLHMNAVAYVLVLRGDDVGWFDADWWELDT